MRTRELWRLIASIALCLPGCVQLPTIGFGVRSTWRAREQPRGRALELLTGVSVGWAGARRSAQPAVIADRTPPPDTTATPAREDAEPMCAEAVFCSWEDEQRRAALAREGLSDVAEGVAE